MKKLEDLLEKLRKELKNQFPPHHWNHISVWGRYWQLRETIEKGTK